MCPRQPNNIVLVIVKGRNALRGRPICDYRYLNEVHFAPDVTRTKPEYSLCTAEFESLGFSDYNHFNFELAVAKNYNLQPVPLSTVRCMTWHQLQQILKVRLEWCGTSTREYCHLPLQSTIHLGPVKVIPLVDTGSDYDGIDLDLANLLVERKCDAFVRRCVFSAQKVKGFSTTMEILPSQALLGE